MKETAPTPHKSMETPRTQRSVCFWFGDSNCGNTSRRKCKLLLLLRQEPKASRLPGAPAPGDYDAAR